MRKPHWLWITLSLAALSAAGCSDDDNGGNGGDAGQTNGGNADGGTSGNNNNGGTNGDSDGGSMGCDLSGEGKERMDVPEPTGTMTLTSDKIWVLNGVVHVGDGETLTIDPCTRIEGEPGSGSAQPGTLVVSRGGKIVAEGTPDEPILFTSKAPAGSREEGQWGGVILLGKAENFEGDDVLIEGLLDAPENRYGGDKDDDNSGTMAYVRIEYGGFELGAGNEINGLTLGSVGSGTELHHIMVNTTLDDCFEWFGGTVSPHHLVCNAVGDDMFDADQGFRGSLEYLFGRANVDILSSDDPNGFEMDSSKEAATPVTDVEASKVTLCGGNATAGGTSYGMVLRENLEGVFEDIAVSGFDFGVDVRDAFGTPADPNVTLSDAAFFDMRDNEVRGEETGDANNDMGFDEDDWFDMGDGNQVPGSAPYSADDCLKAAGPADAVINSRIGAFADGTDDWNWDGLWISWETE